MTSTITYPTEALDAAIAASSIDIRCDITAAGGFAAWWGVTSDARSMMRVLGHLHGSGGLSRRSLVQAAGRCIEPNFYRLPATMREIANSVIRWSDGSACGIRSADARQLECQASLMMASARLWDDMVRAEARAVSDRAWGEWRALGGSADLDAVQDIYGDGDGDEQGYIDALAAMPSATQYLAARDASAIEDGLPRQDWVAAYRTLALYRAAAQLSESTEDGHRDVGASVARDTASNVVDVAAQYACSHEIADRLRAWKAGPEAVKLREEATA